MRMVPVGTLKGCEVADLLFEELYRWERNNIGDWRLH